VGPDESLYLAGAIRGTRAGIAALILKVNPDGTLAYDRAWQSGSTAAGVAVAPDGTLYVSGTLSATSTTAFVLRLLPSGRGIEAATWGSSGTGSANGGGVGAATDGTIRLAQESQFGAQSSSILDAPTTDQNGGYSCAAADQRWSRTVTVICAAAAPDRLGVDGQLQDWLSWEWP
jgi:hypothetical protein